MNRQDVEFLSGPDTCRAWLYVPDAAAPAPVIIMGHGLGAVREMRLDAYAQRFTAAGYACLVFDYRYFGASGGQPRQLLDIDRQLADWASAIAFARTRTDIDPTRLSLWGTSFAGGHVIVAAARDQNIAAVISQCPFTDGVASTIAALDLRTTVKVVRCAIADVVASRRGRAPVMIAVAGQPHSAALMTAPDALPGYLDLVPEGSTHENAVASRIALRISWHRPGRHAAQVRCPILFSVCQTDTVAPAKATVRHARKAPRGELLLYPHGHFDIYHGQPFDEVIADQIAFLRRRMPTTT
ncbi:alpha/beta hydrolase [Mycobacterium spongiae]|uniref:Alpha/beta hydrolase n=1 Tax=Mycobacterium spongiae TaxID=886343 RepID=A0A975JZX7_9MYCO|nr:alpha/beta hydrolase [Mycobacterium spongiae]QUR68782.1 alpha/beta hydrolase [Mycobacterium spongiae]